MLATTRPLGDDIDRLFQIRERIRKHEDDAKAERKVFDQLEAEIMQRLEQEGIDGARGSTAQVGVSESVVADVEDWDEFYRYIARNKAFHLLQRRVSDGAYRELMEQRRKPVPGVASFTKRKLSLRTV